MTQTNKLIYFIFSKVDKGNNNNIKKTCSMYQIVFSFNIFSLISNIIYLKNEKKISMTHQNMKELKS